MRFLPATAVLVAASLSLLGCDEIPEHPTEASPQDVEAVARMVADLDRIAREENLEEFLAYSAEDCVLLAPEGPAVVGRDAIGELYRGMYAAIDMDMTRHPGATYAYGDLLVHQGTATGTMTPADGGAPIPFDNKYLFVLLKQDDGSLKFWRVAFNSNAPPVQ